MYDYYRLFYRLGLSLLVGSVLMIIFSIAGIAAGVSGAGNTGGAEDMLVLAVGAFWCAWVIIVIAIVLHLKSRANQSTLNESGQPNSDDVDSR